MWIRSVVSFKVRHIYIYTVGLQHRRCFFRKFYKLVLLSISLLKIVSIDLNNWQIIASILILTTKVCPGTVHQLISYTVKPFRQPFDKYTYQGNNGEYTRLLQQYATVCRPLIGFL